MEIQIAVEKINKYAVSESGDTVEVIERPNGGISVVLVDGQSSGRGAKHISNLVTRKVISLLAEGVRDGAAARAASDYLYSERRGKVSATLNIISVDFVSSSIVITRNNPAPLWINTPEGLHVVDQPSQPVGLYRTTRPHIEEIAIQPGVTILAATDGLNYAGERYGQQLDAGLKLAQTLQQTSQPAIIASVMLNAALEAEKNRPTDDISIVTLGVLSNDTQDMVRRMNIRLPIPPVLT